MEAEEKYISHVWFCMPKTISDMWKGAKIKPRVRMNALQYGYD